MRARGLNAVRLVERMPVCSLLGIRTRVALAARDAPVTRTRDPAVAIRDRLPGCPEKSGSSCNTTPWTTKEVKDAVRDVASGHMTYTENAKGQKRRYRECGEPD